MKVIGNAAAQACRRWLYTRAENAHPPFRGRERAMAKFRDAKALQELASVHASVADHVNQDRHLSRRAIFEENRCAALAERR